MIVYSKETSGKRKELYEELCNETLPLYLPDRRTAWLHPFCQAETAWLHPLGKREELTIVTGIDRF
jgi:hypothetical protein